MSWDEYTCLNAARNGHIECLKYAHETGVLGMKRLVIMLLKWSIRVFEMRTKTGVLG